MKAKWITLCIAVILIGFFITLTVKQLSTPNELNTNELEVKIKDIYNAEVQTLVKEKDHFIASFNKDGSIFEVNINAVTGQFSDLKLIHKNEKSKMSKIIRKYQKKIKHLQVSQLKKQQSHYCLNNRWSILH